MKKVFVATTLFLLSISANTQIAEQLSENNLQNIDTELFNLKRKYIMETIMRDIPTINADFEVFDRDSFFVGKETSPQRRERIRRVVDNDTVFGLANAVSYEEHRGSDRDRRRVRTISETARGIEDWDESASPLFRVQRTFFSSTGGIKEKGVVALFGFRMGLWYHFDEDGNLIEIVDHDKGFEFTIVDVLAYSLSIGIDLSRFTRGGSPMTIINKRTDENNNPIWFIRGFLNQKTTVSVRIDGRTGRVIEKREFEFHPIF